MKYIIIIIIGSTFVLLPVGAAAQLNATLTVGDITVDSAFPERGYRSVTTGSPCFQIGDWPAGGTLSPATFTMDGTDYCVVGLTQWVGYQGAVALYIGPKLPQSAVLHIGGVALSIANGDCTEGGSCVWLDTPVTAWEIGDSLTVGITNPNATPAIPFIGVGLLCALLVTVGRRRLR